MPWKLQTLGAQWCWMQWGCVAPDLTVNSAHVCAVMVCRPRSDCEFCTCLRSDGMSSQIWLWIPHVFAQWGYVTSDLTEICTFAQWECVAPDLTVNSARVCMISDFRREVDENCPLLGCYAASSGNFLPTFRDRYPWRWDR